MLTKHFRSELFEASDIRTPQTANFQEKKRDLRIYDPFAINKIKLKFY